ncbi:MAG: helix-turn-helix domain-containing protein [Bacteroides sp.]|jgi:putative transcriptional regulator|nr:helix-turn-helix domain-containing protein [Bacteroides sp.]
MTDINRLKIVLFERKKTSKWLADALKKDPATVSKWCTNASQPSISTFIEIAKLLDVELTELFSESVLNIKQQNKFN